MILYLDTSALVKKYFRERGSDGVIQFWKDAGAIVMSSVGYAETLASLYRKKREGDLDGTTIKHLIDSFHDDWASFVRVEVSEELNKTIGRLVSVHPLRGFDAIHLASALAVHEHALEPFLFACFDKRLLEAAKAEGLSTYPDNLV